MIKTKCLRNNAGAVLLMACVGLFVILTVAAGYTLSLFGELANARRFQQSTAAFWLAQAGISRVVHDMDIFADGDEQVIPVAGGKIYLTKDDSSVLKRVVTSTGEVGGSQRRIQVEFPAREPEAFEHSLSTKGDIVVNGARAVLALNDKIRLSGEFTNNARYSSIFIEDKQQGLAPGRVSVVYPDLDGNGKPDEFADFLAYNQRLLARYDKNQIAHVKGSRTYVLTPNKDLKDKKIIYVEGREGHGDVIIHFGGNWDKKQNVTVISTGTVTFNQGGVMGRDAKLNIIAWSGYKETALLPSTHNGIVLTKGRAVFDEIHDTSITNGTVIADGGIRFGEIWSTKTFNYANYNQEGLLPPGFEELMGSRNLGYAATPNEWKEI